MTLEKQSFYRCMLRYLGVDYFVLSHRHAVPARGHDGITHDH
jgi:hypothetical protein